MRHPARFTAALLVLFMIGAGTSALAQQVDPGNEDAPKVAGEAEPSDQKADFAAAQQRITFLLSGYEYFPSREDLDAVAPAPIVVEILRGFAIDVELRPTTRLRAVDAMGFYNQPDVIDFLVSRLNAEIDAELPAADRRTEDLMRHRAINSLARIEGADVVERLVPFLTSEDLQLRLTAISAIGKTGDEAGKKHLMNLKKHDKNLAVQRELHKYVQ